MSGNREQMRDTFDQARRLPKPERAAFLNGLAAVDGPMRVQIEDMLAALDEAGPFLSEPTQGHGDASPTADSAAAATLAAPLREGPGTKIGPYKLLQLIGEGGFGSVFMAEQEKPVARKVALKIIKLGMDTRQVVARFEQERQALAMMDHPNIARVLDAGATETGRPFFVMELVKGDPIVEYCDKSNLNIEDRLELFAQVCNAVQHAHTKGVIHRDIKPSNILICTQDGRPHAKVIDFGIAKATASRLTEKTLFTEHRALIGTPEYMSPEQAEGSLDIDTRTDVYSLGVLLYELLTGTTPFGSKELRSAAYAEIQRIIREVEPPKPSTRISHNSDTIAKVAAHRHTEPKRLGIIVRGELDWIVMKAMEKDRSRRYETANGLGTDIRRYLSGEAVVAAPPSTAYRFKKFIRRNKGPVAAALVVSAALVLGVIGTSLGMVRAERARASEAQQREQAVAARGEAKIQEAKAKAQEAEAKKQAAIAEAVAKFQTDMLATADPSKLLGEKVTVVQAMEAALRQLDAGALKEQPLVEAGVRSAIGITLTGLARYDDAEPNLRKALAICREARPAGHPDIATALSNLARPLQAQNKLAEAEQLVREALALRRAALPAGDPAIASSLSSLAMLLKIQNKPAEAEPLLREALEINRAALPAGHPDIANDMGNLAGILEALNRPAEAEPLFREALKNLRAALPAGHPDIATALNNLAYRLQAEHKFAEAESLLRESLETLRTTLPAGHPSIAKALNNLGSLLQMQNKLAEAEPLHREALAINRAILPARHPSIATTLNDLSNVLMAENKLAEAEPILRESLEIARATLPARHPDISISLSILAGLYWQQGKLDKSVPLFEEALEASEARLGRQDPITLTSMANLGVNYRDAGRLAEAIPLLEEAYRASKHDASMAWIGPQLRDTYIKALDPAKPELATKALALAREFVSAARAELPRESPELAGQLLSNSQTLLALKQWDEAEPLIRESLVIRENAQPDAWTTFNTKSMLGGVLLAEKKLAEAEPLLLDGYKGMKDREAAIPPQGKVRIPEALERLVKLYEAKGNEAEAAAWRGKLEAANAEQGKADGK
jgi:serine/threonine protein kinase